MRQLIEYTCSWTKDTITNAVQEALILREPFEIRL